MLEVGQVHVGGVLGKHLLSAPVIGGLELEETEKEHVTYTDPHEHATLLYQHMATPTTYAPGLLVCLPRQMSCMAGQP